MRDIRIDLENEELPTELAYADDVDFVSEKDPINVDNIQSKLSRFNLNVNTDKTEHTKLKRRECKVDEKWRQTKKLVLYLVTTRILNEGKPYQILHLINYLIYGYAKIK